jgi:segregation and condensation protein A
MRALITSACLSSLLLLLIAATLVELKTRRLLPGADDADLDEDLSLWEERDLLLAKLLECKTFKDAARVLEQLQANAGRGVARRVGPDERFIDLARSPLWWGEEKVIIGA